MFHEWGILGPEGRYLMTQTGANDPGSEAKHPVFSSWILPSSAQPSWDTAGTRTGWPVGFGTYDDEAPKKWIMGKRSRMCIPSVSLAFFVFILEVLEFPQ